MYNQLMESSIRRRLFIDDGMRTREVPLAEVAHPEAAGGLAEQAADRLARAEDTAGAPADPTLDFAHMVARGLSDTPRRLDSTFLYDAHGSQLFERICEQPEYYLTRTEATILSDAAAEIAGLTGDATLVELGSGSSIKTRLLLEAYCRRYGAADYTPVDVSAAILKQAKREITGRYPAVRFDAIHGTYDEAFPLLGSLSPVMMLFLGSTLGNFDAHQADTFWGKISSNLSKGDFCLLGIDINDDAGALNAAYNDAAGYSQAFTRNLFSRMNRELATTLDVRAIDHVAVYNPRWRRVEIFARFNEDQRIDIEPLGQSFRVERGEMILTEVSRKFELKRIVPYLCTFGLETVRIFSDAGQRFAVLLLRRV